MKRILYGLFGLAMVFGLGACGGGGASSQSSASSTTYIGTQTPGDVWSWTLNSNSFTATNQTTGYTYSGSKAVLPSGFLKLTITTTTDPSMTVPDSVYALEYPNTVLLVANSNGVSAAVAQGSCPAGGLDYEWITIPGVGWNSGVSSYGTASSSLSNDQYTYTGENYDLSGGDLGPILGMNSTQPPSFTCSNGILTGMNGNPTIMSATPSGVLMFDHGADNGGGFGMLQPAADIDLKQLASVSYRGVMFKYTGSGQETDPVGANPGTGVNVGNLIGFSYANVETGQVDSTSNNPVLEISSATQTKPGLINFTLNDGGTNHNFVAVVNQINGKYMFFGISTNSNTNEPYNVFMIEQ